MSADLYPTRLYWDKAHGIAKHRHVAVDLVSRPEIFPILRDLVEVDYTPAVRVARVREHAHGWREMTGDEIRAVQHWLDTIATAALAAAHQECPA